MRTLISSKKRKKLMRLILENPERIPGVREAAKESGVSPASASVLMSSLGKDGFVKKGKLDLGNPEVRALKTLFNVERAAPAVEVLRKSIPGVKGVGIFGSWAQGTNQKDSDIDVWVKVEEEPEVLKAAEARKVLEKKLGAGVDLVFLDEKRMKGHMEKNPVFYFSLHYSVVLWGEGV
ncbi:hypothetical protein GF412_00290 [Candidatus Micrarchaeota archaeon]|nr:hypothetical protein [Candidatus Micrarchaeota archaeon]MBD3417414.1 hypothetical protein [Candidatus Micrarchaeota archaeon]